MIEVSTRENAEQCRVITVSDRSAAGQREDLSGPILADGLRDAGFDVSVEIVPDGLASVTDALLTGLGAGCRLIVTTGGTGVGPRDWTPEGTREVIDRELPGISEALRAAGAKSNALAVLSRGIAGVVDISYGCLIINLPGSPAAVTESLPVILPLVHHVLEQLKGADH